MTDIRVGTSGWQYDSWRAVFYPKGLPKKQWLEYYSHHFSSVELNSSFYRLPTEKSIITWKETTPDGFLFAIKASRLITHLKRLNNVEEALATFLDRVRPLDPKLGPILYQLPASFKRNDERLESFLQLLPRGLQHVFEFRSPTWFTNEIYDILDKYGVAFCAYHMVGVPCPLVATGDFVYFRFHGSEGLYWGSYTRQELHEWTRRLVSLARDKSGLYVFFNNDVEAYAVANAEAMEQELEASILS